MTDLHPPLNFMKCAALATLLCASSMSEAAPDMPMQPLYILKVRPLQGSDGVPRPEGAGGETLERSPAMKLLLKRVLNPNQAEPAAKTSRDIPLLQLAPSPTAQPQASDIKDAQPHHSAAPTPSTFAITAGDETLYLALRRWTTLKGYQLIWDAGKDFPARNTLYPATELYEAIEMVMADTERSNYPLHACAYSNRVVRVLHISQSCERKGS